MVEGVPPQISDTHRIEAAGRALFDNGVKVSGRGYHDETYRETYRRVASAALVAAGVADLESRSNPSTRELLAEVARRMLETQNSTSGRELGRLAEEAIANLAPGVLDYRARVVLGDDDNCQECDRPAEYMITAAYDLDRSAVHPTVACYPAPLIRACRVHLLECLDREIGTPFATTQYLLTVRQLAPEREVLVTNPSMRARIDAILGLGDDEGDTNGETSGH